MIETIAVNSFALVILIIVFLGVNFGQKEGVETEKKFSLLLAAGSFFMAVNIISEVFEGKPEYSFLCFVFNLLAFTATDLCQLCFMFYLKALIGEKQICSPTFLKVGQWLCYSCILAELILAVSGKLFVIQDGHYIEGPLVLVSYSFAGVIMLLLLHTVALNRKHFSTKQFTVVILYLVLPIIPIIIESMTAIYFLTPIALTASMILIYVLIQASAIKEAKIRENVLEELSYKDLLTNINNRRAFYETFRGVKEETTLGVVFCDLNGLKYANDNFGHAEGDKLIIKFAQILASVFRDKEIFRTGGDEFIVLMPGVSNNAFNSKVEKLDVAIYQNEGIASVGTAFGSGREADNLIKDAEERMYEDKRENYHSKSRFGREYWHNK